MKQAFAILGAALLVALGLFLPHLAAAYQERSLAGDVRRMENAAVSLTLAQELVELTELDLSKSGAVCFPCHDGGAGGGTAYERGGRGADGKRAGGICLRGRMAQRRGIPDRGRSVSSDR